MQANRLGSIGPQNDRGQLSMYSEITSMCMDVLFKTRAMTYQIIEIGMYRYVLGTFRYIPFMALKYVPGTYFCPQVHTQKQTCFIGLNLVHTGTYSRKKKMYRVHTSGKKYVPGANRFMSVYIAWYIPVCTGMYLVHTTVHYWYIHGIYHVYMWYIDGIYHV